MALFRCFGGFPGRVPMGSGGFPGEPFFPGLAMSSLWCLEAECFD